MLSDDKNYRFGMFYYNKEDDRLFVRNIRNAMGVNGNAVNYAHPIGRLIGIVTVFILIGVIVFTIVT